MLEIKLEKHSNNNYSWYYGIQKRRHSIPGDLAKEIIELNREIKRQGEYIKTLESIQK